MNVESTSEGFAPEGPSGRHRLFVGGQLVEVWENPEFPFRCTSEDIETYAAAGRWILLFNAMTLASHLRQSDGDDLQ